MARYLVQVIVAGSQVIGRAFAKALRQEIQNSQNAARQAGSREAGTQRAAANAKLGLTLQEAKQILNIENLEPEQIEKNYKHLFEVNDKMKGGSFYLQSKIQQRFSLTGYSCGRHYSTLTTENVFNQENKKACMDRLKSIRLSRRSSKERPEMKHAAVIIPLCTIDKKPSILYTKRTMYVRNGGDLSFPGGMYNSKKDKNYLETALRETEEEIGLDRNSIDIWGEFPEIQDKEGSVMIHPVVGFLGDVNGREWKFQASEVEDVILFSMFDLCQERNQRYTHFEEHQRFTHFQGVYPPFPVFLHPQNPAFNRIWGLTAIITHFTLQALLPTTYKRQLRF
ncbi:hypothetical protein CHUAL_007725 [Chamberlinius hualienensis]